ncbi:MAG TPA: hypothetical protein DIU00_03300 [Phycisphaerales bacterium]|nr:hypothetical protein [Phycisphaerales bacterium]
MELTPNQLEQIRKQYRLSPRETQIVDLILRGYDSNAEIALVLDITDGTAKQYVHDLYGKTQTSSKLRLALKIINSIHE